MRDIFLGILYFFSKNHGIQFWYDSDNMQRFIFSERLNYTVLKEIAFDVDRIPPISSAVSDAYSELIEARMIKSFGPEMNPHYITEAVNYGFEKYSKRRFKRKERKELKKLSESFRQKVSLESRVG